MRKLLFVSLLCTIVFSSCLKENTGEISDRWLWDHSQGGVGGANITPSANTNIILVLVNNNTYRIEKNGETIVTDTFTSRVVNDATVLKFDGGTTADKLALYSEVTATIDGSGQLILADYGLADGFTHTFKK